MSGGLPPPPPRHPASSLTRRKAVRPASPAPPPLERPDVGVPSPPRHHSTREAAPSAAQSSPRQLAPLVPPPITISVAPPTPTSPAPQSPTPSAAPSVADTEDDTDDEEDLEDLAFELAQSSRPEPPTTRRRGIGAFSAQQEEPEGVVEEDSEMRQALDALEDEELQEFLGRIGRQVQEVRVAPQPDAVPFPELAAFRDGDGHTDWVGFCISWLATASVIYTPPSLLAPPPRGSFSFTTARNHVERLYVIFPPSVWESLLEGDLARVWRWQSKNSWKWFLLYVGLWTCDLLPFFLPFFFLLLLLRTQLFPPTPAELLERLRTRSSLSAEAVSLSSSLKTTSRFGFAVEGAKGVFASLRPDKSEGGALMRGLHGSAMVGGLAGGLGAGKGMEREREREPSALAKALRHSSFVASGVAAPDRRGEGGLGNSEAGKEAEREAEREVEREVERETTKEKEEERRRDAAARLRKDPDGDVSAYKLATELTRTFGPLTQDYMSGAADLAEKVKNLLLHPDHPSVPRVCYRLAALCLILLVCPTWIQIKFAWAYLGFEFFFLWSMRERFPEWRRALSPIWWLLLDAPTDADYATFILDRRRLQNKPLRGARTLRRRAKDRKRRGSDLTTGPNPAENFSLERGMAPSVSSMSLGASSALHHTSSRASSIAETEKEHTHSYFALLHATPGTLIVSSSRIRFASTRGFRTLAFKRFASKRSSLTSDIGSDSDSIRSFVDEEKGFLMDVACEDVVGVKKEKRLGFEGLEVTVKDGQSWRLTNVSRRDEAFNTMISLSPVCFRKAS